MYTAINIVKLRRKRYVCSKRGAEACCDVMLELQYVSVCVFLQQVDTDEPVFTMTEHLLSH